MQDTQSKNRYSVGSLFAGIGGICLGFKNSGFELIWANDNDQNACKTYRANFKHPISQQSVETLDTKDFPQVDVITSGFPCQAFSVAGYQKGFLDPRGNYFFETLRFIQNIKPKAFLLENVRNLASHDQSNTIKVIKESILNSGYSYYSAILNTKDYGGIPQTRDRVFIVGFRSDIEENFQSNLRGNIFSFPKKLPLNKTIPDFLDDGIVSSRFYYDKNFMYRNKKANHDGKYFKILQKEITKENTLYQWRMKYVRENKNGFCPTLTANMGTGGHNVPLLKDKIGIRKLTPRECARFQGFPNNFILPGFDNSTKLKEENSIGQLYKQIGNSVSVPVIERIALSIKNILDGKIKTNEKNMKLPGF